MGEGVAGAHTVPQHKELIPPSSEPTDPALDHDLRGESRTLRRDLTAIVGWTDRLAPLFGCALAILLVAIPSWPGRINNDTIRMLRDVDSGHITNWHSPILQWLWKPFHEMGVGIAPILLLQVIAAYIAIYLLVEIIFEGRAVVAAISLGICLHPITYGLLTAVIRDTWLTILWIAAIAAARTTRLRGARRLAVVAVLLFLAYASRQNGIVVAPFALFVALSGVSWPPLDRWRRMGRAVVAILMTGGLVIFNSGAQALLGVEQLRGETTTTFDLLRLSLRQDELLLPREANAAGFTLKDLDEYVTPYDLELPAGVRLWVAFPDDQQLRALNDAWWREIRSDPIEYVRMRWQLMSRQIGLSGNTRRAFLPADLNDPFGIHPRFPALADRATDYLQTFNAGPNWWQAGAIHRTWPLYMLLTIAAGLAAARRRGRGLAVEVALTVGVYLLTVYLFAPQLQFRFVAPAAVLSIIGALTLFTPWRRPPVVPTVDQPRTSERGSRRQPVTPVRATAPNASRPLA